MNLGDDHGSLTTPFDYNRAESSTIKVTETGRNTDTFVSFDANVSPIKIADDADINSRLTASYAGADATVTVRDESVDISITSDDFWNSGEPATVTVTAPNLDLNTKIDDDISIISDLIPTIEIGSPITIADFTAHDYGWLAETEGSNTDDGDDDTDTDDRVTILGLSTTTVITNNTDPTVVNSQHNVSEWRHGHTTRQRHLRKQNLQTRRRHSCSRCCYGYHSVHD